MQLYERMHDLGTEAWTRFQLTWVPVSDALVQDPIDRHKVHYEGQNAKRKVIPEIFQKFVSQSIVSKAK